MTGRAGRCVSMLLAMLLGLLCACGGDAAGSGKERAGNMGRRGKSVGASRKLSQCGCGGVPPPPPPPPPSVDCSSCSSVQYEVSPCDENTGTDRVCASCSNLFCSDGQYRSGCGSGLRGSCLTCERCPQDTYRSGCSGETPGTCVSCADSCPDGQYLAGCSGSSPGACTSCPKCEAGRYLEGCRTSSPGTCVFCPIDSSSPEGSISIEACACNAGYTGAAGSFCSACPAGKFKASNGSWPCTDCSAGTYSTHAATSCIDCPAGSNSPSGSSSCAEVEVCISVFGRNGRTVTVAVGGSDSLGSPRDLQFHPLLPDELWVASAAPDGRLSGNYIIRNPGTPEQTTTLLRDRVAFHYMDNVAAFEFSSDGRALFTCQESVNTYTDLYRGNFFQGPTAFEVYPCHGGYGRAPASYCSEVQTDVSNCVPGDSCEVFTVTHKGESCSGNECFLIHSDMLHEAPNCMGLAYEANATTGPSSLYAPDGLPIDTWNRTRTKGNVVWYMDGVRGRLMRFDLDNLHGTKVIDHRLANVRRYVDVHLSRRENVPGHMAMDSTNKHLYISDTGGGRVLRVKTDSGRFHRGAMCTDHQCYPHENSYWTCGYQTGNAAERGRFVNRSMCQASLACEDTPDLCVRDIENLCRSEDGGWCRYGECAGDDGLGCYNAFTEMGNLFEYELWGCTDYEVFSTAAASPTGISLTPDGLILVADYDSGIIVALDKEGRELNRWSSGHVGLTALELQCAAVPSPSDADCRLWFSNTANKKISYIEVVDACETRPTYKLPSPPALQQACTDPGEPCAADRYKTCQMVTMENRIRPDFEDHNGPSWQDRMVIHHSYGKNCTALPNANQVFNLCTEDDCARIGLDPGGCEGTVQCRVGSNGRVIDATTGATRDWADEDATECPDRTDCHNINPDLLVMAGFFCHPCLPNPCFSGGACNNTGPREGFSCDCLEGFSGHSCQCVLPDRCGPIPPLPNTFARLNSTFVFFCGSCAFYVVEVGRFVTLAKGGKCPTTCTDLFIDGMDDDLLARVTHIAGGTFQDMHGLEHLHISNTRVTEITSHAFKGLPRLATMHLSNNKIERVAPDAFIGLGSMASLVLDHNPLTHTTAADLLRITEAVQGIDIRLPVQYWLRKFDEVDAWKGNAGNYDLPVNRVTVEWGDPKYSRCEQPYSWYELKRGYKERMITFKTGGLGRLLDTEHEAWLCLPDHPCADVGDWFCFVYNEVTKIFIPWGTNRELGILQLS